MGIIFKPNKHEGGIANVFNFWRGEAKVLPCGFKPVDSFKVGTIVPKCYPIRIDFESRTARLLKFSEIHSGSTNSSLLISGTWNFWSVGDVVCHIADKTKTAKVVSVEVFNEELFKVTLDGELGLVPETIAQIGYSLVFNSTEATESTEGTEGKPAEVAVIPNAVTAADLEISERGIPTIDAAYDALVLAPYDTVSILSTLSQNLLNGFCLKENPNIMFITQ